MEARLGGLADGLTNSRTPLWITLAAIAALLAILPASASADRQYSLRHGVVERGDIAMAANTIVTCPEGAPNCASARAGTGTVVRNSAWVMVPIDVDGDPSTFDSSSSDLRLPPGATILYAGLYWGSDTLHMPDGVDAPDPSARGTVKLRAPDGAGYRTITASTVDSDRYYPSRYQGFADVTSLVQSAGAGTYTVGNVQASTGKDQYGGWGLVVAYRDPSKPVRWLGIYDGFREFSGGDPADVPIAGFKTPASGTVRADFGMLAYEGDVGVAPDSARLNGLDLTDALHDPGNYWNARITEYGQHVTTKNPNYVNQLGMDANIINADGKLPNNATSASVHMEVSTDLVMPGAMTLVSDQAASAPAVTTAPAVTGTARDGQTLSAGNGTWSGTTPMTFAHRWQRCNSSGASCVDIDGATGATYAATAADVGSTLRVRVRASNVVGPADSTSAPTAVVAARPPVNTAAPTVTGTAQDGQTLTATDGTWTGSSVALTRQWRRCDSAGAACADIGGATGTTYLLAPADVGRTIRVDVTGTNSGGSVTATSAQTRAVAALWPAATAAPVISGSARDGGTLTATDGTWTGTPTITFARQWLRCDGADCVPIPSATGTSYTLTPADVGRTIRVAVTGTNAGGASTATSAATAAVLPAPPASTSAPTVTGTARDGETLGSGTGSWTGTPAIELTRQWRRCDAAGSACADVAGATDATYSLGAADVGRTLRLRVTARNAGGEATADSPASAVVAAQTPSNTAAPTIEGVARDGSVLTARDGTWTGTEPIARTHQWLRCDSAGAACASIAGATAATYELVPADVGRTIRVEVRGANGGGSSMAISAQTATVEAGPPVNATPPSISGVVRDGGTLTAAVGDWTGTPTIGYTRSWRRCEPGGIDCANIAGATGATYVLTAADVGRTIRVRVTAANGGGERSVDSAPTAAVAAIPPSNGERPTVSGLAREGEVLSLGDGVWSGSAPLALAYRWERCDVTGSSCVEIGGATSRTYTLAAGDAGSRVRGVVTAGNPGGAASARSDATDVVAAKPVTPPPPKDLPPSDPPPSDPPRSDPPPSDPPPAGPADPEQPHPKATLAATQWKSSTGTGLRLRLASADAIARVGFAIPATMLPKRGDARRVVGRIAAYPASGAARTWTLTYPRAGVVLVSGRGAPKVELVRDGLRVGSLPAGVRLVKLTLYTRNATNPKALLADGDEATLGASVRTAAGSLARASQRLRG